jgi:uncharacterized protein (DUF305 family)
MTRTTTLLRASACAGLLAAAACGGGNDAATDSAAATAAATDTGAMTGMRSDSAGMAGMGHGAAMGDRGFLTMMSDHHEGLVAMAMPAMNKASGAATKTDAHNLHTKQAAERDSMVAMLRTTFSASHTPTVMPKNRAQNDSLQSLSGQAYDRKFYQLVVAHHREGIAMIDSMMPSLTDEKVKQMATKMKADQQREIQEFERKAGGAG